MAVSDAMTEKQYLQGLILMTDLALKSLPADRNRYLIFGLQELRPALVFLKKTGAVFMPEEGSADAQLNFFSKLRIVLRNLLEVVKTQLDVARPYVKGIVKDILSGEAQQKFVAFLKKMWQSRRAQRNPSSRYNNFTTNK